MFADCTSLANATVSAKNGVISSKCFMKCSSLKSVDIKNAKDITSIDDYAFSGCTSLTSFPIN